MPLMPTSWRASLTSSSLNGLMIASIFFMGPCLGLILPVIEQAACQCSGSRHGQCLFSCPPWHHPPGDTRLGCADGHGDGGVSAGCLIFRQPAVQLGGVAPVQPLADPLHGESDILDAVGVGDAQITLAIGPEAGTG